MASPPENPRPDSDDGGPTPPRFTISPSGSDEDIYTVAVSWRTCLRLFADTCAADFEMLTILGDSLESVSYGFLLFLHHLSYVTLSAHHVWELPAGVLECGPVEFRSLLKQVISFEAWVSSMDTPHISPNDFGHSGPALGPGVERSVFERIFQGLGTARFENSGLFWNTASRFLIPRFEPGEPASLRATWWYTFGRLLGLHIIRFGQVPRKVSPILLLALFSATTKEMFVTLEVLSILDRELAETLRPWFEIPIGGTLPRFSSDVVHLLAGQAQMDVSEFSRFDGPR